MDIPGLQRTTAGTRPVAGRWLPVPALAALLISGCAAIPGYGMSEDQVAASWVGHNIDELQSRWKIIWDSRKDSATGTKVLIARFGENEHVVSNDYVDVQPVGNNQYIHNYVSEQQTVPRRDDCVVEFFWDPNTGVIVRHEMSGDRCRMYVKGYGPPKAR